VRDHFPLHRLREGLFQNPMNMLNSASGKAAAVFAASALQRIGVSGGDMVRS
jgi:hypothetical protein